MRRMSLRKFRLARQSLGVPGTASFRPFGATSLPCVFPFTYFQPELTRVRTKADTVLSLLYLIGSFGPGTITGAGLN